jgi:hypothetical protein
VQKADLAAAPGATLGQESVADFTFQKLPAAPATMVQIAEAQAATVVGTQATVALIIATTNI